VPSLVSLLREHAWGDAPAQALLHMAQNKGLEQLVCLAHRWNLKLLHERYGSATQLPCSSSKGFLSKVPSITFESWVLIWPLCAQILNAL